MGSATVALKDLVLYLVELSRKHVYKEEANDVVLLRDAIDYKKLLQLYLAYGLSQIREQLENFAAKERAQADTGYIRPQVWANDFRSIKLEQRRSTIA